MITFSKSMVLEFGDMSEFVVFTFISNRPSHLLCYTVTIERILKDVERNYN